MTEGREHEAMILDVVKRAVAEALDRKRRLVVDECEVLALLRGKRLRIANGRRGRALFVCIRVLHAREPLVDGVKHSTHTRVRTMVRLRRHMAGEFVEVIQRQIGQSPSIHDPKYSGQPLPTEPGADPADSAVRCCPVERAHRRHGLSRLRPARCWSPRPPHRLLGA
jgi:hypothetical protein